MCKLKKWILNGEALRACGICVEVFVTLVIGMKGVLMLPLNIEGVVRVGPPSYWDEPLVGNIMCCAFWRNSNGSIGKGMSNYIKIFIALGWVLGEL